MLEEFLEANSAKMQGVFYPITFISLLLKIDVTIFIDNIKNNNPLNAVIHSNF